jgi:hypothetical protein
MRLEVGRDAIIITTYLPLSNLHTSTQHVDRDSNDQADSDPNRVTDLMGPNPEVDEYRGCA